MILHAVTRDLQDISDNDFVDMIQTIIPYVDYIQLREKSRTIKSLCKLIEKLLNSNIPRDKLIVNDRADIAHIHGIPRTHLTENSAPIISLQDAFPDMLFGRSFHRVEAVNSELKHYDYGYIGHIFPTQEKNYAPLGIKPLAEAYQTNKNQHNKLIAIGGINQSSIDEVAPFADGIAVMSLLFPVCDDNYRFDQQKGLDNAQSLRAVINTYQNTKEGSHS